MLINNDLKYDSCPLCFSTDITMEGAIEYATPILFSTVEISLEKIPELRRCRNCKSGFIQNIIPEHTAKRLYSEGSSDERWSNAKFEENKPKEIVSLLRMVFKEHVKLLDIGSNTGELLDFARKEGCDTYGFELSPASQEEMKLKGHRVVSGLEETVDTFDIITAVDLIEHIYDVPGFLRLCAQKLTDRGMLIILTGNINSLSSLITKSKWWYLKYPEHIVLPSLTYFQTHTGLRMMKYVRTYASVGYKKSFWDVCKGFLYNIVNRSYIGLPSLGPDHLLIVLEK